jgi:hypothetical protein
MQTTPASFLGQRHLPAFPQAIQQGDWPEYGRDPGEKSSET